MQKYTDVVQDINGNAVSGASVTIKVSPGGTTATIYSTNTGTSQSNPITTDSDGRFTFYAKDGSYYASVSKTGITGEDGPVFTLRDTSNCVNVLGYGAVADGGVGSGTDSSAAFTAALAAANTVIVPPGSYSLKDITIPSGKTLLAYGAYFYDRSGAAYVFNLTGYSAKLVGAYISSATNCSVGAVVVDNGRGCEIDSTRIVNATTGILLKATTAATGCARTFLSNIFIDTFTGVGIDIKTDVSEINATNVYIDAGTISGGGALIPRTGAIGVRHVGTSPTVGVGGHLFTNVTCINMETGWSFTDSQLTKLVNCIADSCSGRGLYIAGNSYYMDFDGLFIGTVGRGVECNGTVSSSSFTALRTVLIGSIPAWGGTTFYSSGGYSATFYDFVVNDTASVLVDANSWVGTKSISVASGATLNAIGGEVRHVNTNGTVAAGSTVYLQPNGSSATESFCMYTAPYDGKIFNILMYTGLAPGAGETFTYTVRANSVDTTLTAAATGAGVFSSTITGTPVNVTKGQNIAIKLVTSASAAVTSHRGYIHMIPRIS